MSNVRILSAYRVIFCALIVTASIQTLAGRHPHHAVPLAVAEIAGALLLLWRRTQWIGAAALLVVLAAAQVLSAFEGEYPTRFIQYCRRTVRFTGLICQGIRHRRPPCRVRSRPKASSAARITPSTIPIDPPLPNWLCPRSPPARWPGSAPQMQRRV